MCFTTCTGYCSIVVLILQDDPWSFVNSPVFVRYSFGIREITTILRSIFISRARLRKLSNDQQLMEISQLRMGRITSKD